MTVGCVRQGLLSSDSATSATGHYAMIHARRGKFIIISNTNFTSSATSQLYLPPQRSAEHDVAMLQDAFSRLGFDVVVHCNKTTLQMISIIAAGSFFLFFLYYYSITFIALFSA